MDEAKLRAMQEELASRGTHILLVVRHDTAACEWYASGWGPTTPHGTASLAKAMVGGTSFALALTDGLMRPDDLACKYVSRWRNHPLKSKITLRHLATHTSGIEDAEADEEPHEQLEGWKGAFWRRDPDPFSISLEEAPCLFEPGTRHAYSNPGMAALSYAITVALQGTPHKDIHSLLKARVMEPMGVPDSEWLIGYGQGYELDGLRLYANWGGAAFTGRATARLGRLMLRNGDWDGKQLLARAALDQVLGREGRSGLCWALNLDSSRGRLPRDAFTGSGANHSLLLVVPSLDLVVVRYGEYMCRPDPNDWMAPYTQYIFDPVMEAVQ